MYIYKIICNEICMPWSNFANRVAQQSAITIYIPEALEGLMKVIVDLEMFWKCDGS